MLFVFWFVDNHFLFFFLFHLCFLGNVNDERSSLKENEDLVANKERKASTSEPVDNAATEAELSDDATAGSGEDTKEEAAKERTKEHASESVSKKSDHKYKIQEVKIQKKFCFFKFIFLHLSSFHFLKPVAFFFGGKYGNFGVFFWALKWNTKIFLTHWNKYFNA